MNAVLLEQEGERQEQRPQHPLFLLGNRDSEVVGGKALQSLLLEAPHSIFLHRTFSELLEPFPGQFSTAAAPKAGFVPGTDLCVTGCQSFKQEPNTFVLCSRLH